jgi:hypothetical protein
LLRIIWMENQIRISLCRPPGSRRCEHKRRIPGHGQEHVQDTAGSVRKMDSQ